VGYLDAGRTPNELARSAETKEEVEARSAEHPPPGAAQGIDIGATHESW